MTATSSAPSFVRPRAAAGVLFFDAEGQVLMVYPSYKDYLDIPGGYVEPGETPFIAARRELREELGIDPAIGDLLVTDWWQESTEGEGGSKILFIFDGGVLSNDELKQINVDGTEIVEYRFHQLDGLDDLTIPRLANRIRHAAEARRDALPRYLENGLVDRHRPR